MHENYKMSTILQRIVVNDFLSIRDKKIYMSTTHKCKCLAFSKCVDGSMENSSIDT